MGYISSNPNAEKKRLYNEMEKLKDNEENVSGERLNNYLKQRGQHVTPANLGRNSVHIRNRSGEILGTAIVKKKKVNWWSIN